MEMVTGSMNDFVSTKQLSSKKMMLKHVREDAGIGCLPQSFTTNASETANFILRNKVDYKRNQLFEFVEKLKQVIDDQEKEVEKAVIQRGKYCFKSEYKYLEVPESQGYKMTSQQRKKCLDRIAHASVTGLSDTPNIDSSPSLPTSEILVGAVLAVDVHEVASEVTIPLACIQGIWTEGTELWSTVGSTVPAPGHCTEARLVLVIQENVLTSFFHAKRAGSCATLTVQISSHYASVPTELWLPILMANFPSL